MKRMHIHVAVGDLEKSIGFYSTLFGAAPTCGNPTTRNGASRTRG